MAFSRTLSKTAINSLLSTTQMWGFAAFFAIHDGKWNIVDFELLIGQNEQFKDVTLGSEKYWLTFSI